MVQLLLIDISIPNGYTIRSMKRFFHVQSGSELPPDYVFETKDVLQLTGIPSVYLNKFIERKSFGLRPSVRTGGGRGSRRLFITPDLYGVSLVWWLFESGLRSKVIDRVIRDFLPGSVISATNVAGLFLVPRHKTPQALVIYRDLQWSEHAKKTPKQQALQMAESNAAAIRSFSSVHIIPVGRLLLELIARIKAFRPKGVIE
jgi:hypothetical protein